MSINRECCIIYHSDAFTSGDSKAVSSSKNGAVRNKLCHTSLISFNTLCWPGNFVNREDVEGSDLVTFIWCVPEIILTKEMGKLGLDSSSGVHKVCKRLIERECRIFCSHVDGTAAKGKVQVR